MSDPVAGVERADGDESNTEREKNKDELRQTTASFSPLGLINL